MTKVAHTLLPLSYSARVSVDRMYLFTIYIPSAKKRLTESFFRSGITTWLRLSILLLPLAVRLMSLFCRL